MKKWYVSAVILLSGLSIGCSLSLTRVPELPAHCITEEEWGHDPDIFIERMSYCGEANWTQAGRCAREDYLEAYCYGVNEYRATLGADD